MGTSGEDGRIIFLEKEFYIEHKDVLEHLILQFGGVEVRSTPLVESFLNNYAGDREAVSYKDIVDFLARYPKGGSLKITNNAPLLAYLRLHGVK